LNLGVKNPFATPLLLNVQQNLPMGTEVIESAGGTVAGTNGWEITLAPGGSLLLPITLQLAASDSSLPSAQVTAYDAVSATWLQFAVPPTVVRLQAWPSSQLQPVGFTNGGFEILLRTFVPGTHRIDATTDFVTWERVSNITNVQGVVAIRDAAANSKPVRFYRVVQTE
jgi:hypothetical protein